VRRPWTRSSIYRNRCLLGLALALLGEHMYLLVHALEHAAGKSG
jgi:hypothetical protein